MVEPIASGRRGGTVGHLPALVKTRENSRAAYLPEFSRVKTTRAFEDIAEQIRKELSLRRLRPGDRLPPERVLAEQFGVSRNTLREALRSLENSGLLRLRKGASGGAFVGEIKGEAIISGMRDMFNVGTISAEHLTEARVLIENTVVRMACTRATSEDIAALNDNIVAAERAGRDNMDFYEQAAIQLDFHRILARATKNPVMSIVMEALIDVMQHFIRKIGQTHNRWVLPSRYRFMKHFEAGNSDAAATEMQRHLERLNRYYLSLLREKDRAETVNG